MFTALVQQQQENIKGFVKIIMDATISRLEVYRSLQYTQKDDIKMAITKRTQHYNAMQSDILKACHNLLPVTDKLEYLQSRWSKLVFNGREESLRSETEAKVKKVWGFIQEAADL